jgi:hypothetical protein
MANPRVIAAWAGRLRVADMAGAGFRNFDLISIMVRGECYPELRIHRQRRSGLLIWFGDSRAAAGDGLDQRQEVVDVEFGDGDDMRAAHR